MDGSGSDSATQNNTVLFVWAKTDDDISSFPNWADAIPSTLVDFYQVMSYNQHIITTKVATKNGGFYVSEPGHSVSYYKNQYNQSPQGYEGPWGIFVEEILGKVESDKGAGYFDDVDLIIMMVTDGGPGWYDPSGNYTAIGWLGVDYQTGNGKIFDSRSGGVTSEFSVPESDTKWTVCHEYGHFLGFSHRPSTYGTYSLMYWKKLNEAGETVTPLCIQNIIAEGWLDLNNANRVKTVTFNTTDFWNLSNKDNFAPWTNPNTEQWTGGFTDYSVKVETQSGNDVVLDILTNSPPAAPQNLIIVNAGSNGQHPVLQWDANSEPDLDHYNIYRGWQESKNDPIDWDSFPAAARTNTTRTDPVVTMDISATTSVR